MNRQDPSPDINWDTADGAHWASHDDAICRAYAGKWVVALPGKVIASGDDPTAVGTEAARLLGADPSSIVVRSIVHPDEWLNDYPVCPGVPASEPAG
jgi:hypothetical protein